MVSSKWWTALRVGTLLVFAAAAAASAPSRHCNAGTSVAGAAAAVGLPKVDAFPSNKEARNSRGLAHPLDRLFTSLTSISTGTTSDHRATRGEESDSTRTPAALDKLPRLHR